MTNPNSGRNLGQNVATQTLGVSNAKLADIQDKNAQLKSRGVGFTIDPSTLVSADAADIDNLHKRVVERYTQTFGINPTDELEEASEVVGTVDKILELADDHQLVEIHIGSETYPLMSEPLSNADVEVLSEILDALSVETGNVEQTYLQSMNEKIDDLVNNSVISLSSLRNSEDQQILESWSAWYDSQKPSKFENEASEEDASTDLYAQLDGVLLNSKENEDPTTYVSNWLVERFSSIAEAAAFAETYFQLDEHESALSDKTMGDIAAFILESEANAESDGDESDYDSEDDDTDFTDSDSDSDEDGETLTDQLSVTLDELRDFNVDSGFAPLGLVKLGESTFDLDSGSVSEFNRLTSIELAELCVIVAERLGQLESYADAMENGEFDEDEFVADDEMQITDADLADHLDNPEFDEFDQLSMVEISNRLVFNFPVNKEGAEAFADRDLRKELSSVQGFVYDSEGELVAIDQTCNTLNLTSKKSNGWLRPAIADIVKYLNRLNGTIPAFIADPESATNFACSLGDSIAEVLQVLPIRSAFGQLVDESGVIDEDGELHSGLDERYTLNNILSIDENSDQLNATIVNHFTIDALTVHHKEVSTAVKTLLQAVSTRASIAKFPVVTTFTFDAVEAMGETNDIYVELINQGFSAVSRSELSEILQNGENHEAIELLGLDEDSEFNEGYNLDVVFGNSDILLYLPTVNL
jgi:hypothetical protein